MARKKNGELIEDVTGEDLAAPEAAEPEETIAAAEALDGLLYEGPPATIQGVGSFVAGDVLATAKIEAIAGRLGVEPGVLAARLVAGKWFTAAKAQATD